MFLPHLLLVVCLLVVFGLSPCMQTTALKLHNEIQVQCVEKERQALLTIKEGLIDPSNRLSSWVEEVNCCQWRGVKCDNKTGNVVMLDLHNPYATVEEHDFPYGWNTTTSLGGEISSSLLDLRYLRDLDLSLNNFSSNPIPVFFGSLVQLRSLNLSQANFGGQIPPQIGNLSNLNYLDLNGLVSSTIFVNNLDWLSQLRSLIFLDLSGIDLSPISDWLHMINHLPWLKELYLRECGLGEISSSSSSLKDHINFTSIKFMDMSANSLSCGIFNVLWNTSSLLYLDFSINGLNCSIPRSFMQMESLTYLDLEYNDLKGPIPDFLGNITSLTYLDLEYNDLKGPIPYFLGNIISLTYLDLKHNDLEGGIPSNLEKLCNLQYLDLSLNNLTGNIPDELWSGCISNSLEVMYLSGNKLYGHLPKDLGKFHKLVDFDLSSNSLEGVISEAHLSGLSKLEFLIVSSNSFIFNLSFDWIPPFQLEIVWLGSCLLGPRFPSWLQTQKNLVDLDISHTGINDMIPNWFWDNFFYLQRMDLHSNQIFGKLPPLAFTLSNVSYMDLSSNQIFGKLPPRISPNLSRLFLSNNSLSGPISNFLCNVSSIPNSLRDLDLSKNHLEGMVPDCLMNFPYRNFSSSPISLATLDLSSNLLEGSIPRISPNISELYLSNNSLSGPISNFLCNVSSIPKSLQALDLSKNHLEGMVPDCLMNFPYMEFLSLAKNHFTGAIPSSIGYMSFLSSLHLNMNNFSGELPLSLKNCTALATIDFGENRLSGKIPPWLGENLSVLNILRLHSNRFIGDIPFQICRLQNLQVLDLGHNSLWGNIPICLYNFSVMSTFETGYRVVEFFAENAVVVWKGLEVEYGENTLSLFKSIDLSSNNLSGQIPREMMNLAGLCALNLSRNHLVGEIPYYISNLSNLESLDFSRNHLSGALPWGLANLSFLSNLDLSHNNFSGTIPLGTQLQSMNASSYIGNPGLCGPPLSANCTTNQTSSKDAHDRSKRDEDGVAIPWFYIGLAMGYILGFWVVCGALLLNQSWRIAYFRVVEEVHDWLYVVVIVNGRRLRRKFGYLRVRE